MKEEDLLKENVKYTPKIIDGKYVLFAASTQKCGICEKLMIRRINNSNYFEKDFFPGWVEMNQDAQMKRGGLVYVGNTKTHNGLMCQGCEKDGKGEFRCELCFEMKPTNKIEERFGDPTDFLCTDCYESAPAKIWDEKVDELESEHQYG